MLSYLSGNVELGTAYYNSGNHRIYAYAESDFGSDESRKACADYVFILANGAPDSLEVRPVLVKQKYLYRHAKQK